MRALALDSDLGEAHSVLAYVTFVSEFGWESAERGFKRALELTPGNADIYELYARLCVAQERYDEAIAMLRRAHELDPMVHRADLATALLRAGALDEALQTATHVIELDPEYARGHATVGWALVKKGRYEEGLAHLKAAVSMTPGDTLWLSQLGQAYAIAGHADQAREVLRELEALLNALQNSIMFTPWGPRAGPTGGAGSAFPAGICSFTWAAIFFFAIVRLRRS